MEGQAGGCNPRGELKFSALLPSRFFRHQEASALEQLLDLAETSRKIVVFTGSGLSANSGKPRSSPCAQLLHAAASCCAATMGIAARKPHAWPQEPFAAYYSVPYPYAACMQAQACPCSAQRVAFMSGPGRSSRSRTESSCSATHSTSSAASMFRCMIFMLVSGMCCRELQLPVSYSSGSQQGLRALLGITSQRTHQPPSSLFSPVLFLPCLHLMRCCSAHPPSQTCLVHAHCYHACSSHPATMLAPHTLQPCPLKGLLRPDLLRGSVQPCRPGAPCASRTLAHGGAAAPLHPQHRRAG